PGQLLNLAGPWLRLCYRSSDAARHPRTASLGICGYYIILDADRHCGRYAHHVSPHS
ncbi:hypothetical protein A2U01_0018046, partial [Trifolium medium]|nr:hypothetical protein [Trifolium medium]